MNRGQLKTRVSRLLGVSLGADDDAVEETAFLEELANEAVKDVLTRTRVHVRDGIATLAGNTNEYDIDDGVLRMIGIKLNGNVLYEEPRDALTDGYAFVSWSRIVFAQPTVSGDKLQFWYTPLPSPMTDDTHDPAVVTYGRIPTVFHKALVDYMCWQAADKLGDQQAGRGEKYRVTYEGQTGLSDPGSDLGRIRLAVNTRGGIAMVRRRRESLVSDREPQYWTG
jgi:hypothetical protein